LWAAAERLGAEAPKPIDAPKASAPKDKDTKPLALKLPDGTFLWLGASEGERITLTPQEFQKLLDRAEALKKELAARKPAAPSGCAVKCTVQKRGEQLVALLQITYTFRTAQPNAAVSLGGKKAFLVEAALDGAKLPILETSEDGFAVTVDAAGAHTLVLEVEAPVTARGVKSEVGFEIGLPRSPITTFVLAPAPDDVKRVTVATRTPDPAQATKAGEVRRMPGLEVKQLSAPGIPLGPADSLEVTWDPPAASAQVGDHIHSAEIEVAAVLTEGFVESTARIKLRGPGREWRFAAPASADVSVDRGPGSPDMGPTQAPTVTKPSDSAKLVWKVVFPVGSSAADWTVTAVVRQARAKAGAKPAGVAIGPFAVLDVLRQTGTVRVTAGPHTRFAFRHGPDLRRAEVPGADDDTNSAALFRLATGPTGAVPAATPLLVVEAWPVEGAIRVKPTYKFKLTEAGWRVAMEVVVKPIRTETDALTIEVPAEWRGIESESEPELVAGVSQGEPHGVWLPVTVKLAAAWKQQFVVTLGATVPLPPGAREAAIPLPRFPRAVERDTTVTATVPEGLEVHGSTRAWDGDVPTAWGMPLTPVAGIDGKMPKAVAAVTGKGDRGLARVVLNWQPYHPDITAEVRADVTLGERQIVVSQVIKLRSPDGFPKPVRFHGPAEAIGLSAKPPMDAPAAGAWTVAPPSTDKEAIIRVIYALPLPPRADGSQPLPIGLLWPADAPRTEMVVRVWINSIAGRTVAPPATGWRELPPEPAPERDALPVLTLAAAAERPLVLESRPLATDPATAVEVKRALIEAGPAEDGSIGYRARFRLERWLSPGVEFWLPDSAAGTATATIDGASVGLVPVGRDEGRTRFRVPLPEGAPGRTATLEVLYAMPTTRSAFGATTYVPPQMIGAAFGATRWLVTEPADSAPLLRWGGRADLRWRQRGPTYAPASVSHAALDRWLALGSEPRPEDTLSGAEGEAVAIYQTAPTPVRVARIPWLVLVVGCSFATGFAMLLVIWVPGTGRGVLVAVLGGAVGAFAVLFPQPAAQAIAAAQPGVVLALAALGVLGASRWHAHRQVTYLPGFTRTMPEPSAVAPGAASTTPQPLGALSVRSRTSGPAPVAPSGSGS
jgi:hypothetical protein